MVICFLVNQEVTELDAAGDRMPLTVVQRMVCRRV
jgi:hypothetical protein